MGYCFQTITLEEGKATKYLRPLRNENLKERECKHKYDSFGQLITKIDLVKFNDLEETIGCPDCADGGAEWIEIFTQEGSKKVMYEYGNPPKEVKPYLKEIKSIFEKMDECN